MMTAMGKLGSKRSGWWLAGALSVWSLSAEANVIRLPFQYFRGWCYVRFPREVTAGKIRVTLPYELPASAHFHVLVLPEHGPSSTFAGTSGTWPKGWLWDAQGALPLAQGAVSGEVGGEDGGMPVRVAPAVFATLPAVESSKVAWGSGVGLSGIGEGIQTEIFWKNHVLESRFQFHADQPHARVREFSRGGRTAWLDVEALWAGLPANATSVLIAFAPYHQRADGQDDAFSVYPPKDAPNRSPTRLRQEGDYPNDPLLLWAGFVGEEGWRQKTKLGWNYVFGAGSDRSFAAKFTQAWLNGAFEFDKWRTANPPAGSGRRLRHFADVGLRRPERPEFSRTLVMDNTSAGMVWGAARFPGSLLDAYFRTFGVGQPVGLAPLTRTSSADFLTPVASTISVDEVIAQLPAFNNGTTRDWMEVNGSGEWDLMRFFEWLGGLASVYPEILPRMNQWFQRAGEAYANNQMLTWSDLLIIAFCESVYVDPATGERRLWAWDAADIGILFDDFLAYALSHPDMVTFFTEYLNPYLADFRYMVEEPEEDAQDVLKLRPPLAWATLTPPLFGQLGVFASAEPMNVAWTWWRASASNLAASGVLAGVRLEEFPWPGWFPVDAQPWDVSAESWWMKYQRLPWAHLLQDPVEPSWGDMPAWRFMGYTDPSLFWGLRIKSMTFWPPQPPGTRASNQGADYPMMVLPTAAFPLGPIEVLFTFP